MKRIDLNAILKIIDIKNILAILLIIMLYFSANILYLSKNSDKNKLASEEILKLQEETKSQKQLVDEITANGNDSIQTLLGKLAAYETVLPKEKMDTLELELLLRKIAGAELEIGSITRNSDLSSTSDNTKAKFEIFTVTGVASLGILEQFLNVISFTSNSDGTVIMSVETLSANIIRPKNSSSSDLYDLQSSPNIDFEVNLRVWYNSEKGILTEAAEKAALDAIAEQDSKIDEEKTTSESETVTNN